jgi:CRISPR-associated exonuclease Cas4
MTPKEENNESPLQHFIAAERHPQNTFRHSITGLMVQYYTVCERELWFMSRGLDIDRDAVNIRRGTHVDETSYRDNRDSFQINGSIQLDVLDSGDIMEVKVSSTLTEPARNQLLYYLWYLDEILDIQRDGILAFPTERKRERIELTPDNKHHIQTILTDIISILDDDTPPPLEKKPVCDACLYQDLCWM